MTSLSKPIVRRTSLDPKLGRREAGEVTVALYPDSTIGFRKLRSRKEVRLPLSAVYSMALKADLKATQAAKQAAKKVRRK